MAPMALVRPPYFRSCTYKLPDRISICGRTKEIGGLTTFWRAEAGQWYVFVKEQLIRASYKKSDFKEDSSFFNQSFPAAESLLVPQRQGRSTACRGMKSDDSGLRYLCTYSTVVHGSVSCARVHMQRYELEEIDEERLAALKPFAEGSRNSLSGSTPRKVKSGTISEGFGMT